jgi:CheY-like chemotaxis protein
LLNLIIFSLFIKWMKKVHRSIWIIGLIAGLFFLILSFATPYIAEGWNRDDLLSFYKFFSLAVVLLILGLTFYFSEKAKSIKKLSEENSNLILNKIPNCVWVISLEDKELSSFNKAAEEIFEIAGKEQRLQAFEKCFYDSAIVGKIMEGKSKVFRKVVMIDKNYDPRYVDLFAIPFQQYSKSCILVMAIDQSEAHRSLEKIKTLSDSLKEQHKQLKEFSFINSHKIRSHTANILGILNINEEADGLTGRALEMVSESALKLDVEIKNFNKVLMENSEIESAVEQVKKTIVFVDDDKVQHMINKRILLKINSHLNLVFFEKPYEALAWLMNNQADVILLDINMPEMDGWHFLELMSKKGINIDVKMLTSSLDPEDLEKSRHFKKVSGFLIKPLKNENIVKFLAS